MRLFRSISYGSLQPQPEKLYGTMPSEARYLRLQQDFVEQESYVYDSA